MIFLYLIMLYILFSKSICSLYLSFLYSFSCIVFYSNIVCLMSFLLCVTGQISSCSTHCLVNVFINFNGAA